VGFEGEKKMNEIVVWGIRRRDSRDMDCRDGKAGGEMQRG